MSAEAPVEILEDLEKRAFFLTGEGNCACRLKTGIVVELPVGGKVSPRQWDAPTIEYVRLALLALESSEVKFTRMPEYAHTDGRVSFPIAAHWFGWGRWKVSSDVRTFVLFGSYH